MQELNDYHDEFEKKIEARLWFRLKTKEIPTIAVVVVVGGFLNENLGLIE